MNNSKFLQKEYLLVAASGTICGAIVFSGQIFSNLGLSLFETSTLPFIFVVIALLPYIIFNKDCRFKVQNVPLLLLYGLISASIGVLQFAGVYLGVPVAIAVLLLYTQPLWTILLSTLILKEKVGKKEIYALVLVMLGVLVLINPFVAKQIGTPIGLLLSLLGGVALSGWITVGSHLSKKQNNPINTLFSGHLLMLIFLGIILPIIAIFVKDQEIIHFSFAWPLKMWIILIAFGLVTQIMGHLFYLNGTKKVPTVDAGIIMLLEPVSAAILSVIFLKQPLTINIIIGGIIILAANYLVITSTKEARHD